MSPTATVLQVDDDQALLRLVEEVFEDETETLGYVSATTGEEALAALGDVREPVILLVDRQLPGTDLWTFVEEVADRLEVVAVPTFVLSGSEDPNAVEDAYANGAAAYLEKPIDVDGFYQIAELLERFTRLATLPVSGP
jgi:CheY-like chemotaxis protein